MTSLAVAPARRMLPLVVFSIVILGLGASLRNDPRKMPSMLIDKAVPTFKLEPVLAQGPGLSSQNLRGRTTLLNVFASWCPGCRREHPTLMRVAAQGRYPLYGINWKDKPGDGARWLAKHKNPYIASGEDASGRVGIDLGVTGVPETFVIDSEGRIRFRHAGPVTDDVWRDVLAPLLAELEERK